MNEYGLSLGTVGALVHNATEYGACAGRESDRCWLRFDTSAFGQGWKSF